MSLEYGKMDFTVSFNPLTAFPLDARSYFESYSAAVEAAESAVEVGTLGSKYYFGETICVVENGAANMYIINPDGTLGEVGGKIEIDENAFELVDGVLNLLGFADAVAGAQLVKNSDGTVGWVKPDTTTVEGLSTSVTALQLSVANIQGDLDTAEATIEDLSGRVEALETTTGSLSSDMTSAKSRLDAVEQKASDNESAISGINISLAAKANAADVYTKNETDLAIEAAVVAADHLRRIIVDSVDDIDVNADNALLYIYMVANGLEEDDNKYYEYIVIEAEDGSRSVERVGSWEVNLSDYVTTAALNAALGLKADKSVVDTLSSDLTNAVSRIDAIDLEIDGINESLGGKAAQTDVDQLESDLSNLSSTVSGHTDSITAINLSLADKAEKSAVEAVDGKVDGAIERIAANEGAISDINSALDGKAEASVVEQLDSDLDAAVERIAANEGSITGLNASLATKADKSALEALQTTFNTLNAQVTTNTGNISTNTADISNMKTSISNIESALNNYVTTEQHTADILAIQEMLKWTTI